MNFSEKKLDHKPDSHTWIRDNEFFITATAFTVLITICSVYDAMNRLMPKKNPQDSAPQIKSTQEPERRDPELERISGDIDGALGACNNPKNAFCIPSLLLSFSKEEPVTIDMLRCVARHTSPELCSPCCRVLDAVEEKPHLIAPTLLIAKAKLAKLSSADWRKHIFMPRLHECEKQFLERRFPLPTANSKTLDAPKLSL